MGTLRGKHRAVQPHRGYRGIAKGIGVWAIVTFGVMILSTLARGCTNYGLLFLGTQSVAFGIILLSRRDRSDVVEDVNLLGGILKAKKVPTSVFLLAVGLFLCFRATSRGPLFPLSQQRKDSNVAEREAFRRIPGGKSETQTPETRASAEHPESSRIPKSQIGKPVIISPRRHRLGFPEPCVLQVTATSEDSLSQDSVMGQLSKRRLCQGIDMPQFDSHYLATSPANRGRQLVVTLDTAPIINAWYGDMPHGLYRTRLILGDKAHAIACETYIDFSYIYQSDFTNLERDLTLDTEGFSSIPGGGLQIRNQTRTGRYISARLNRGFDFVTNFVVEGCFSINTEDVDAPPGFDIAFLDEYDVSRLSVIFVDGRLDTIAIKTLLEASSDEGVRYKSARNVIMPSTGYQTIQNYFQISIVEAPRGHLCSVRVRHGMPDFSSGSLVHERLIQAHWLERNLTHIELRLWKAGTLRLYYLIVAEIDPSP